MNNKNHFVGRCVLFSVIFFITAVLTFLGIHFSTNAKATMAMEEAALPVVMIGTQNGTLYNRMNGYTKEINAKLLDMDMTLLGQDRKLSVVIDTYNETIKHLSYKIRATDASLIENTTVSDYEEQDGRISANLNIKNLIRDNTPYTLEIILATDKYESISYYTTIYSGVDYRLQEKIDFVLNFNACTFDEKRLNEINRYLETKSWADNTNYGKVNIYNTRAMVGWGDLQPFLESNIVPSVQDINDEVAIVTLDYTIGAANGDNSYDTYMVHEYYRIRQTSANFYLLNFDRETTQIFDGKNDLTSSGKINLGIHPDNTVEALADKENKYVFFVNAGTLWCFSKEKRMYTQVFSFCSDDTDNVRERYSCHRIRLLSADEEGNCRFLVYGYMNRGMHEGEVGVSLYEYRYRDNRVTENIYIPTKLPYNILCDNVAEIACVRDNNAFYIKLGEALYSIDLVSSEAMTEADGLKAGNYYVSKNGRIIAYHVGGEKDNSSRIRIFNTETGKDFYIQAGSKERVKVLGFVMNDLIYGVASEENIVTDEEGGTTFAMHKLYVVDAEFQILRDYEAQGTYVVSAVTDGYRINLNRVVKAEDGTFRSTSIDQLINREENVAANTISVDKMRTEARKTEVVIAVPGGIDTGSSIASRSTNKIEYKENQVFYPNQEIAGDDRYYTFGNGVFRKAYTDLAQAIEYATDHYGEIYDYAHRIVWKRFKAAQASIKNLHSGGCLPEASYAAAKEIAAEYAKAYDIEWVQVTGTQAENMLAFVSLGCPVIGKTLDGYVIITGYTQSEITYLNTMTGKSITGSYADINTLFAQCGNVFLTYYKK